MNPCHICKKTENLLICIYYLGSTCSLTIHSDCYGVHPTSSFECDSCKDPSGKCFLCSPSNCMSKFSPMRKSLEKGWVHLACKRYLGLSFISEAYIDKNDENFPVKNIENIDDAALFLKCSVCGVMAGLCVNCAEPACNKAFHPYCAISSGQKIEVPRIQCLEHSGPAKIEVQIEAYKIRDVQQPKTLQIFRKYPSSSVKNPVRSKQGKVNNNFDRISDYFSLIPKKVLEKTILPYDKSSFTLPVQQHRLSSKCRVLFQGHIRDYLLNFSLLKNPHKSLPPDNDFIIVPKYGDQANLRYSLTLQNFTALNKETSSEHELISRCLNETIYAEDEVTKEILFNLEYYQRKIIPLVNATKDLVGRLIEKKPKFDMTEINKICAESGTFMQWTMIYKNLKAGLEDKEVKNYETQEEHAEFPKIDCSICFNYDEDNYILNPTVYCSGCRLIMHKACVGVSSNCETFMCQVCLSKSTPYCFVCHCKEWPMKNSDSQWFHITCALWEEKVEFINKQFLEGIILSGSAELGSCYICRKPNGLLSKCLQCTVLCHLMCAWRAGFRFITKELNTEHRRLHASLVCDKHEVGRDLETQKKLRLNAFTNYLSPRVKNKRPREFR